MAQHIILLDEFSSSDESDLDYDIIEHVIADDQECFFNICRPRIPRTQHFIEEVVNLYNDHHFQKHFR